MTIRNEVANLDALVSTVNSIFNTSITTTEFRDFPQLTFPDILQPQQPTFYYSPTWYQHWELVAPKAEKQLVEAIDGDFPSYPVSNLVLEKDGTCVLELAAIGFDKNEITVERNGEVLEINANKEKEEKETRVYAHHKLSERNWKFKVRVPDIYDADKLKVSLEKGKLTVRIPLKEENKPVQKKYDVE